MSLGSALPDDILWDTNYPLSSVNWDYAYIQHTGITTGPKLRNTVERISHYFVCEYSPGLILDS